MYRPPTAHGNSQTGTGHHGLSPWQIVTTVIMILGLGAVVAGSSRACALPEGQIRLGKAPDANTVLLIRNNPRLAEMQQTAAAQERMSPLTYGARVHLANRANLEEHVYLAALNQGWLPVPPPAGYTSTPDTFVLPQEDLPLLADLETAPLETASRRSAAPPRAPSPGPLVKARFAASSYVSPSTESKALIAGGAVTAICALIMAVAANADQNNRRKP